MPGPKGQKDYGGRAIGTSTKQSGDDKAALASQIVKNFLRSGQRSQQDEEGIERLIGAKGSKDPTNKSAGKEINKIVDMQLQSPEIQDMMQNLGLSDTNARRAIKASLSLGKDQDALKQLHQKIGGKKLQDKMDSLQAQNAQQTAKKNEGTPLPMARRAREQKHQTKLPGIVHLDKTKQDRIEQLADTALDIDQNNEPIVGIDQLRQEVISVIDDMHIEMRNSGLLEGAVLTLPADGEYAIIGDNHGQKDTLTLIQHLQEKLDNDPDFKIIFAGDLVSTKYDTPQGAAQGRYAYEASLRAVLPFIARNKGRVFMIPGNHEIASACAYEYEQAQTQQEKDEWERRGGIYFYLAQTENSKMRDGGASTTALVKNMPTMIQIGDGITSPIRIITHGTIPSPPPDMKTLKNLTYEERLDADKGGKLYNYSISDTSLTPQEIDAINKHFGAIESLWGHSDGEKVKSRTIMSPNGEVVVQDAGPGGDQYAFGGTSPDSRAVYLNACSSGGGYYLVSSTSKSPGTFVRMDDLAAKAGKIGQDNIKRLSDFMAL